MKVTRYSLKFENGQGEIICMNFLSLLEELEYFLNEYEIVNVEAEPHWLDDNETALAITLK